LAWKSTMMIYIRIPRFHVIFLLNWNISIISNTAYWVAVVKYNNTNESNTKWNSLQWFVFIILTKIPPKCQQRDKSKNNVQWTIKIFYFVFLSSSYSFEEFLCIGTDNLFFSFLDNISLKKIKQEKKQPNVEYFAGGNRTETGFFLPRIYCFVEFFLANWKLAHIEW